MVVQYPETLVVTTYSGSTQNSTGDFIAGTPTQTNYPCRSEYLRGGGLIKNADGVETNFNWIVYMPLTDDIIAEGSKVVVKDSNNNVIITSSVVRFLKGQMNVRVWL